MTLAPISAAIANLRRANANLLQAARLLDEAGEKDHSARVTGWAADVVKLANAGAVTVAKATTPPAKPAVRRAATTAPAPTTPAGGGE